MTTRNEALKATMNTYSLVVYDTLGYLWNEEEEPPVFEAQRTTEGKVSLCRGSYDEDIYNLSEQAGRKAWKAAAPEGCDRFIVEDGLDFALALTNWLASYVLDGGEVYLERTGCE